MYEDNSIMKIAWLYYMENMTQQQIAEKLNISRMKVVKSTKSSKNRWNSSVLRSIEISKTEFL